MKTKSLLTVALALILNACSPFTITSVSGEQPTPVVEYDSHAVGYQAVTVDNVEVEVGMGSPIPVHVNVSGSLPDTCSQIEYTEVRQDGSNFIITLSTVPSNAEGCIQDTLPFRMSIPLNVVNLPEGPHQVNVNGVTVSFDPRAVPAESGQTLIPAGWTTHTSQRCEYALSYPSEMRVTAENPYSSTFGFNLADPDAGARNFIYVSVIAPEIQSMVEAGVYNNDVYNYDPVVAEILLNMQVGESKAMHEFPNVESGFTYQRKPDTQISGHTAQSYENVQPWEFPNGTKEIRYYLSLNGCTYQIGGYVDTTQSNLPGGITEELFNQIVATIQLIP